MGGGFSCNGFELDVMRRFPNLFCNDSMARCEKMPCSCGPLWILKAFTCCFSFNAIGARLWCNGFKLGVMRVFVHLVAMNQSCDLSKCCVYCGSV